MQVDGSAFSHRADIFCDTNMERLKQFANGQPGVLVAEEQYVNEFHHLCKKPLTYLLQFNHILSEITKFMDAGCTPLMIIFRHNNDRIAYPMGLEL